ncbi:UNVERIFIED_CONTAM: hypothetical protein Sindi_0664400 [Sesamum indicum]
MEVTTDLMRETLPSLLQLDLLSQSQTLIQQLLMFPLDLALGVSAPIPTPTLNSTAGPIATNLLFYKQLCQFIMETIQSTLRSSQASRGGTRGSQEIDEYILAGLQQDRSTPADFAG